VGVSNAGQAKARQYQSKVIAIYAACSRPVHSRSAYVG
jgi:hypothetical protein